MNQKLFASFLFVLSSVLSCGQAPMICLNQSGYYPFAPKVAAITAQVEAATFFLIDIGKKDTVYKGRLGKEVKSTNSSLTTRKADFSSFTKSGNYILHVPGVGDSYPFFIRSKMHLPVAKSSLKAFYYQRVSEPLLSEHAGKWARAAG